MSPEATEALAKKLYEHGAACGGHKPERWEDVDFGTKTRWRYDAETFLGSIAPDVVVWALGLPLDHPAWAKALALPVESFTAKIPDPRGTLCQPSEPGSRQCSYCGWWFLPLNGELDTCPNPAHMARWKRDLYSGIL